jgi:hypothetical protein
VNDERSIARGERRLAGALTAFGIAAADVTALPALNPWARTPRTFAITTATRERIKIRFARRARYAARAAHLTARFGDPRVAPPLAVRGTAMMERWVDGEALSTLSLDRSHVDAAAEILAAIHAVGARSTRTTTMLLPRLSRQLAELTAAGTVARPTALRLERLVVRQLPKEAAWGVTHGDLCDENLVVGTNGALSSIDNEAFCWGFLDYDLARTWYRWPMPAWAEARFSRRYWTLRGEPGQTEAWRVLATVKGLHIRLRAGSPAQLESLALRRILESDSARA